MWKVTLCKNKIILLRGKKFAQVLGEIGRERESRILFP